MTNVTAIGKGGQKLVFGAQHPIDGEVVIKLILPGQDVQRVQREVLAVQTIQSSRVPKVLDGGIITLPDGPRVWLREQRIDGASVRQVLAVPPLPVADVRRLGLQMLEALADAERARIVHRDVKPDNIMRDAAGNFWLLDFGLARHLDLTSLTASGDLGGPGTLGYAPPEQFRNQKRQVDSRADLFALAVTMVECLTGIHPFRETLRVLAATWPASEEQLPALTLSALPAAPTPDQQHDQGGPDHDDEQSGVRFTDREPAYREQGDRQAAIKECEATHVGVGGCDRCLALDTAARALRGGDGVTPPSTASKVEAFMMWLFSGEWRAITSEMQAGELAEFERGLRERLMQVATPPAEVFVKTEGDTHADHLRVLQVLQTDRPHFRKGHALHASDYVPAVKAGRAALVLQPALLAALEHATKVASRAPHDRAVCAVCAGSRQLLADLKP